MHRQLGLSRSLDNYTDHFYFRVDGVRDRDNFDFIEPVYPKTWETKINNFSSTPNDLIRNVQFSGQATSTNKTIGARDRAKFYFH